MRTFRRRPIVVSAIQWTGINVDEIRSLFGLQAHFWRDTEGWHLELQTVTGRTPVQRDAWIEVRYDTLVHPLDQYQVIPQAVFAQTHEEEPQ